MAHDVRAKLAATVLFGVVVGGGVAVAQWSSLGVGEGGASAGVTVDVTVTGGSAPADLHPGATGDLAVELDNPNDYAVRFTSVVGGSVTPSRGSCPPGVVTLVEGQIDVLVPARADDHPAVLDDIVRMDRSAPDGCQGTTFAIEVSLAGTQA